VRKYLAHARSEGHRPEHNRLTPLRKAVGRVLSDVALTFSAKREVNGSAAGGRAAALVPLLVMHRQPDGGLVWRGPLDPVFLVSGDVDEIAGLHFNQAIFEAYPGVTLQDDDPFVLVLVVPISFRRCVAVRHDALDADVRRFEQGGAYLLRQRLGEVMEEIGAGHGSGPVIQDLDVEWPLCRSPERLIRAIGLSDLAYFQGVFRSDPNACERS